MLEADIQSLLDARVISKNRFGKYQIEYDSFLVSKLDSMGAERALNVIEFLRENGEDEFPFYTSKKLDKIMKTLGF